MVFCIERRADWVLQQVCGNCPDAGGSSLPTLPTMLSFELNNHDFIIAIIAMWTSFKQNGYIKKIVLDLHCDFLGKQFTLKVLKFPQMTPRTFQTEIRKQ